MKATIMQRPLTLNLIFERAQQLFSNVEVTSRRPDKSLHATNYGAVCARAEQLAQALLRAGLKRGDRVGTLMWNHSVHLEAYFGIPLAGGVLHTLNLRLYPEDIAYIAGHAEDRFLIVDDVLLPLYEQFRSQAKFERVIVVPFGGPVPAGHESYETFIEPAGERIALPELDENAPCGMCYTSGTTGKPKGVVYAHRSTVLHALGMALPDAACLSMRDTILPVVPMFHANAWGLPYVGAMVGARQVYPGPHLDAESLLDLFERTGTTFTGGVPTIWMGILQCLRAQPGRWKLAPGLRMMVGGSAVPPSLIKAFAEFGIPIYPGWGLTETSPLASLCRLRPELDSLPEDQRLAYQAKAGLPLPLVELRIWNEGGAAPWDGQAVGEIEVRGPWVTGSYYQRPDSADRFSPDGWFRTGDIACMTPEGYITITDRAKDLIKSGGEWISSVELENELMAHPAVAEAAVIAIAHEKWMERPLAVVVKRPGATVTDAELRAHLRRKFAEWWMPDGYAFVDAIPRTSTGKFMKTKLREMFARWKTSR